MRGNHCTLVVIDTSTKAMERKKGKYYTSYFNKRWNGVVIMNAKWKRGLTKKKKETKMKTDK